MEIVHYYYPRQTSHFQNESRETVHFTQKSNNSKEFNTKTFVFAIKTDKALGISQQKWELESKTASYNL